MKALTSAQAESLKLTEGIAWYDAFDAETVFSTLTAAKRDASSLQDKLTGLIGKINVQTSRVDVLRREASLGLDPRYWFSSKRSDKKRELRHQKLMLADLTLARDQIQKQSQAKSEQIDKQQSDLDRFRGFDRLQAESIVKEKKSRIDNLKSEIQQVGKSKAEIDLQLIAPLAELEKLTQRKIKLEREIDEAEYFENRLSSASNSYERRMIHEECDVSLGDSKPAKLIRDKRQEIESINRNIVKLGKRLESISQRASRIIKTLVIDGNNLCYEQRTFIGPAALQAVAWKLSRDFAVLIVFDASIRRGLQMNDQEISMLFGDNAKVHIVASKNKADETLLDSALDSESYVISNDRFVEFPEKSAVRDKRLIKHEILNGKVFIHDLNLAENFQYTY